MATDESASTPDDPVERRILDYLHRELVGSEARLDRDAALLSGGVLDSMGVLRLATFVGEAFGIEIQPADFVIENFSSVAAVAAYVAVAQSRSGGGDGPGSS
jgi:acyl carrier protein